MDNQQISELLKGFKNLQEFSSFLEEQINDGEQISKGKNPLEKSKEEKAEAEDEAPEGAPEGGEEAGAETPVVDPVSAPGSQVSVGNKKDTEDAEHDLSPKIKVGEEEKDVVKTKAKIEVEPGMQ